MCFAIIGGNWVVFGSLNGILKNYWAKYSLIFVFIALAVNVIGAWGLTELLRRQVAHGEDNAIGWEAEYQASLGNDVSWPFTKGIANAGIWIRVIKGTFTLLSGALFVIGALKH
jgi:hypothetical protein